VRRSEQQTVTCRSETKDENSSLD